MPRECNAQNTERAGTAAGAARQEREGLGYSAHTLAEHTHADLIPAHRRTETGRPTERESMELSEEGVPPREEEYEEADVLSPLPDSALPTKQRERSDTRTNFAKLHSRGLAEDTPGFRQRLHQKYVGAVEFETKAQKVVGAVDAYLQAMRGFGDLTACIEEVLPDAMGNSSAGAAHDVIGLFNELSQKMDALSQTVRAMVVEPINSYLDGELAAAKAEYHKYLDAQKRVEKSRIEYMKMTTDTGTEFLATKEKSLGEDHFKLELQRFDSLGKLDEVQQRTSGSDAPFWQRYPTPLKKPPCLATYRTVIAKTLSLGPDQVHPVVRELPVGFLQSSRGDHGEVEPRRHGRAAAAGENHAAGAGA